MTEEFRPRVRGRLAPHDEAIARICDAIGRQPARSFTVVELARRASLSRFHFIRIFKAHTGQTPHQYVRARRIDRARHLLETTVMPVTEVCEASGFESLGSFTSLFRRLTGESPAAYRARRRKTVYIPGCFVRMYRAGK